MKIPSTITEKVVYPLYELFSGRRILTKLSHLRQSQWWKRSDIQHWQQERLRELLEHAQTTVPYYRQVLANRGLRPSDIRSRGDLTELPLLRKSTIREHGELLTSSAYPERRRIANHTGGSTGTPMDFYHDKRQRDWGTANKLRCNRWAGWDFGKRTLRLWGHPRDLDAAETIRGRIRAIALNEHMFDAFDFSRSDLDDLVSYVHRKQPEIIVAYASMISHFAQHLAQRGTINLPQPEGIITSADMLLPHHRTLVERVFRAPVFDRYGCREVGTIASECEEHAGLHISSDRLLVEFVDENGEPVSPGVPGRVVVTDLFGYAMPFIRYDIGDVAIPSKTACSCGRELPLINELVGRYADILTAPDGRFVSASALTTILHQVPGLVEAQLVQEAPEALRVNAVQGPGYSVQSERAFRSHLREFFGDTMGIIFEYVDDIPKTSSGKTRFSISRVDHYESLTAPD